MRISDWSSDVCSSDLAHREIAGIKHLPDVAVAGGFQAALFGVHVQALALAHHQRVAADEASWRQPLHQGAAWHTQHPALHAGQAVQDRKSVGEGTSVSVRVDLGGRRIIKTKTKKNSE